MSWNPARESTGLGPFRDVVPVTPSDTADLPGTSPGQVAVYVFATVAGNVVVDLVDGQTRTVPVGAGFTTGIPMLVRRVRATSTTATGIFACYV